MGLGRKITVNLARVTVSNKNSVRTEVNAQAQAGER